MSIKEIGNIEYFGHKCIYIQDDMNLIITPINDKESIQQHYFDSKDKLVYTSMPYRYCVASIKEQTGSIDFRSITLSVNYYARMFYEADILFFTMEGNEIDEFFSPLDYYHSKRKSNRYQFRDLLYEREIIDSYKLKFEDKNVQIDVIIGDVLTKGRRSDLSLHSKLKVTIEKTRDLDYIYRLSNKIKTFLRFVHRKQYTNLNHMNLYVEKDNTIFDGGFMFSSLYDRNLRPYSKIEGSFIWYKNKLEELLTVVFSDEDFSTNHLFVDYNNFYDYSPFRIAAICSAFEHEYKMNNIYNNKSQMGDLPIKKVLIKYIDNIAAKDNLEKDFLKTAKDKIKNIGNGVGLIQKIKNAYQINKDVFESSYIERYVIDDEFTKKAAESFAVLRNKKLHDNMDEAFSDEDLLYVRFIDMLQFAMVLRRSGYDTKDISIIVGILFACNSKYLKELYNINHYNL